MRPLQYTLLQCALYNTPSYNDRPVAARPLYEALSNVFDEPYVEPSFGNPGGMGGRFNAHSAMRTLQYTLLQYARYHTPSYHPPSTIHPLTTRPLTTSPLHLFTSSPLHLFTSSPLRLFLPSYLQVVPSGLRTLALLRHKRINRPWGLWTGLPVLRLLRTSLRPRWAFQVRI
jgi:hypothetical protein